MIGKNLKPLRPRPIWILRLEKRIETKLHRRVNLPILKILHLIDPHQQLQRTLRIIIVKRRAIAAITPMHIAPFDIAPKMPALTSLDIKINAIIPTARSELPPNKRARRLNSTIEKQRIARSLISLQKRHTHSRRTRRLHPDRRGRRRTLALAHRKICLIPPQITAMRRDIGAKIARRHNHRINRSPMKTFICTERRTDHHEQNKKFFHIELLKEARAGTGAPPLQTLDRGFNPAAMTIA